jgi:hypothetical protein
LPTTSTANATQRCQPLEPFGTLYQVGDLAVGVSLTNVAWPSRQLPSTLPHAPYKVVESQLPTSPAVNPHHDYLFGLVVCNTGASASHTLQGVRVRIESFAPTSGPVNSWWDCSSTYVSGSVRGGGCGGAYTAHEVYQAAFAPSAGVGAIAAGTFVKGYNPNTGGSAGPLPRTLTPGQSLVLALSLTATQLKSEISLDDGRYGNLEEWFSYAFAAGGIFFGFIADRVGPRRLYPAVLTSWSLAGVASPLASWPVIAEVFGEPQVPVRTAGDPFGTGQRRRYRILDD